VDGVTSFLSRFDWLAAWLVGLTIVVAGVVAGRESVSPHWRHRNPEEPFLRAFVHWDADYYTEIAENGYSCAPGEQSTIHFFPAYSLAGRLLSFCTGIAPDVALVLLSNLFFAASLFLIGIYVNRRCQAPNLRRHVLFTVSLLPVGFFFRMGYTESMFLMLVVLQLYLIDRDASCFSVAAVAGICSATRPVGIVLVIPFLWYFVASRSKNRWFFLSLPGYLVLCVGGLLMFMAYCQLVFGDALIFARNRIGLWAMRPTPPFAEKAFFLATLEPVGAVFDPASPGYWGNHRDPPELLFNLYLVNSIYFVGALLLIAVGIWKRWLNAPEALTALGLVLLPYCLTGYEGFMNARARYVSVAFPLYLVLGRLMEALSVVWKAPVVWLSSVQLAGYSAYFAQCYWLT